MPAKTFIEVLKRSLRATQRSTKKTIKIGFPEPEDHRVVTAARALAKEGIIQPLLYAPKQNAEQLQKRLNTLTVVPCPSKVVPDRTSKTTQEQNPAIPELAMLLYTLRKEKGLSYEEATQLVQEPIYTATLHLYLGHIDGVVSGASHPTAHTLKPALQIIKTKRPNDLASTCFFMVKESASYLQNKKQGKNSKKKPLVLVFADCALTIKPTAEQLAAIAVATAQTAQQFGINPKIAMLSFSTKGSAQHEEVTKVQQATALAKQLLNPQGKNSITIDGELQFDAAFVPAVAKRKDKNSVLKGKANVFIFPDLNAGNIGYKIAQRLGGYQAIGPIVQGLAKPVNDLSRGCSVQEIIDVAYITAWQASTNQER